MIGRERLLTPEEAEAAGYFAVRDVAREMGMSRVATQRLMYELIDAGSVARVKVSGRGGGYYYGAAGGHRA